MRRLWLVGLGILLVVGAAAWVIAMPDRGSPERPPEPVSVRVTQATIILRNHGQVQAEIAADRVELSADRQTTTFTGQPRAVIHVGGVRTMTATGGRIILQRPANLVTVDGGLRIVTAQGETLAARAATWDQESQVVDLTGGVEVAAAAGVGQAAPIPAAPRPSPSPAAGPEGLGRLRADRIRYDARAQVILATGNVVLAMGDLEIRADSLRLEQGPQVATAEGGVTVRQRDTRLVAPVLRYEFRTEMAEATGGVILAQKDATIKAPRVVFDLRREVTAATGGVEVVQGDTRVTAASLRYEARTGEVAAEGGVTLIQPGSKMTGRRLLANLRTRRADVRDDVTLVRGKDETTITAARIIFRWDASEGEAEDHVVIRQRDRTAWADRLLYSEPANRVTLSGHVVLEQQSGESLVREGVVSPPRDPTERAALGAVTRLTCARLVMALRERDIVAEGPVVVTQTDRSATGDRGTYTGTTRLLVLSGNVHMQEADGRRLRADRVVISLIDETFEAEGNVQTEFVIRASPTRRP